MKTNTNGFTMVEVALVIAIAGLIFGMTFAIVPNILANERDSERREDMISFISTLQDYQQNNSRGNLPGQTKAEQEDLADNKRVIVEGQKVLDDRAGELDPSFSNISWGGFYRDYFTDTFEDPAGYPYNFEVMNCENTAAAARLELGNPCTASSLQNDINKTVTMQDKSFPIYIVIGASCDGSTPVKTASNRQIAAIVRTERSGPYCFEN